MKRAALFIGLQITDSEGLAMSFLKCRNTAPLILLRPLHELTINASLDTILSQLNRMANGATSK
jgi:hypothetical protein